MYSDAGNHINHDTITLNSFNDIFHRLSNTNTNMVLNKLPCEYKEKDWSKGDVLDYYNVYDNK